MAEGDENQRDGHPRTTTPPPAEEVSRWPAQVRVLRRRIRSAKSTKKITKAMELVATSRIAKAQERVAASLPYAEAITGVLTALASNASVDHPLLHAAAERCAGPASWSITSDRGLAAATTPTRSGPPSS